MNTQRTGQYQKLLFSKPASQVDVRVCREAIRNADIQMEGARLQYVKNRKMMIQQTSTGRNLAVKRHCL
jgi:hypothetical protein